MSAFLGIFRRDGQPILPLPPKAWPPRFRRETMSRTISGAMLLAASEVSAEPASPSRRALVVAADARIDNRDEIEDHLGLHRGRLSTAALIGRLYERHGPRCPAYLLGDFAFLIWDAEKHLLFGARDPVGVRPFYFHASHRLFAAATSIGPLLASGISAEMDRTGMADFVAGAFADRQVTLHRHIARLPPAHAITVTDTAVRIEQYWRLEPEQKAARSDMAEQFRHLFQEAVACRMSGQGTGVLLSGGLDSSSIALVASRLDGGRAPKPLPAFSMTFEGSPGWSDGEHIRSVLRAGRFSAHFLPSDDHDPLGDMDTMLDEQEGLFLAYNQSVSRRLYHAAGESGLSLLLDGHGGDEVVSHGFGRLNELAVAHRWRSLWREAGGVARTFGMSTWSVASPHLDHVQAIRTIRRSWRHLAPPASPPVHGAGFNSALVAADLARATGIRERHALAQPSRSARQTEQQRHLEVLSSPHQPYAFEVLDRTAAAAGVTLRFPFYDRRLVEFCLSAPSNLKLANGFPRAILRDAMTNILPETVRLRRDKFDFSGQLRRGLGRHAAVFAEVIRHRADALSPFIDLDVARSAIQQLDRPAGTQALFAVWRIALLARWIDPLPCAPEPAGDGLSAAEPIGAY